MCLAIPAQIIKIYESSADLPKALVSVGGIQKEISLAYVPEAKLGDYVLVHVGFALSIVDAEKAQEVFKTLQDLDQHFADEDLHLKNQERS